MTTEQLQARLSQLNASLQQLRGRRYTVGQQIEELQREGDAIDGAIQQMFGAIQMAQEFIDATQQPEDKA